MKKFYFTLIIALLLTSCAPATIKPTITVAPASTATSTLAPTPTLTPTITPTSTIAPTPLPLTLVYQDDVPVDGRVLEEQAAKKAYIYYSQYVDMGQITIYTFSDVNLVLDKISVSLQADYGQTKSMAREFWPTTGGFITGNDVVVNSGFPPWSDQGNGCYKAKNVSHEMFHLVQRALLHHALNRFIDYGPEWLKEGSAEMMGNRAVDGLNDCDYKKTLDSWFQDSRDADFSLQQVEGGNFSSKIKFWSFAPWAVDYLINLAPKGERSLVEYYSEIGDGTTWRDAFETAFGISVQDFYTTFQAYQNKTKITMDTSICVIQSDSRVKCLGREPNRNNEFDYVFKIPFVVKTQPQQWKWESSCNITGYGAQGTGNVNELLLNVDKSTQGNCHVKFTFSADQQVTVDFAIPVDPSVTVVPTVTIQGKVVLSAGTLSFDQYVISFCNIKIQQCLPGSLISADGTFSSHLIPGEYLISVSPIKGGEALGWYSSKGLVKETSCTEKVQIDQDQEITILIDPSNISPCP